MYFLSSKWELLSTFIISMQYIYNIDGSVQDCSSSIANALELLQSCTKPSICYNWMCYNQTNWITNRDYNKTIVFPILTHRRCHIPLFCINQQNHEKKPLSDTTLEQSQTVFIVFCCTDFYATIHDIITQKKSHKLSISFRHRVRINSSSYWRRFNKYKGIFHTDVQACFKISQFSPKCSQVPL